MTPRGKVVAVNISPKKGTRKKNVDSSCLLPGLGLEKDAHAAPGNRQVSLLALESIEKMVRLGLKVGPGDFAENITTRGWTFSPFLWEPVFGSGTIPSSRSPRSERSAIPAAPFITRRETASCPERGFLPRSWRGERSKWGTRSMFSVGILTISDKGSRENGKT